MMLAATSSPTRPPDAGETAARPSIYGDRGFRFGPIVAVVITLAFLVFFLVLPLIFVLAEAFARGAAAYFAALNDAGVRHAIYLTLLTAGIAVPLNLVFGLAAAWAIGKFEFPGRSLLITLIDLPFAVSPVISGLVFVLIFSRTHGYLMGPLNWLNIDVIFSLPGLVLATVFVTFPFVARELIPLMEEQGDVEEQAAISLGASGWQTFWHVTLPNIKWALLYGVILCNARAMGEFGAVSVVSGSVVGKTMTLPLQIEFLEQSSQSHAAFAAASLLAMLALVTLTIKTWLEWRIKREHAS